MAMMWIEKHSADADFEDELLVTEESLNAKP